MKSKMLRRLYRKLIGNKVYTPSSFTIKKNKWGGFESSYHDFQIHSHEAQCISGVYKQIFLDEVYHFSTNKQEPLIVDVGSNIGLGILYWKKLYPGAQIVAFEPSREVFRSLKKNIDVNKIANVRLLQKAVSDFEGTAKFTANEKISGSLVLEKNLEHTYEVEVVKLSDFLKEIEVDFLKMDIEGGERKVFFEILPYLSNVDNLFLEYHSFVHETQYLAEILKHLQDLNFRYYIEDDFKVRKPLTSDYVSLGQDMKLNIWAKKTQT